MRSKNINTWRNGAILKCAAGHVLEITRQRYKSANLYEARCECAFALSPQATSKKLAAQAWNESLAGIGGAQ
jgi:hypothetical protein